MPKKRSFDAIIPVCTLILVSLGIVMIYSSSAITAANKFGDPYHFLKRQLVYAGIGTILMVAATRLDYRKLFPYGNAAYIVSVVLLLAVMVPAIGKEVSGARRWLALGPVSFQPSEMVKLGMILFFATYLYKKEKEGKLKDFTFGYLPNLLALGLVLVLILMQPDLGNALVILSVALLLFFVSGVRIAFLAGTILAALPCVYVAVCNVGYRKRRILSFLDPWSDPTDSGFQIIQSFLALGNGGIVGQGLGNGKQKLFYLPEAHTDFIFSVIGEELGLIGCVAVILFLTILISRGVRIALKAPDSFGMYLAFGISIAIAIQAVINIGVTIGLLPTKGLPLPFISSGGTALCTWLICMGILMNISEHT